MKKSIWNIVFLALLAVTFQGCFSMSDLSWKNVSKNFKLSNEKVFEPENVAGKLGLPQHVLLYDIVSMNKNSATLENGSYITKNGITKEPLPQGFKYLNSSEDGKTIAADTTNQLMIGSASNIIQTDNIVVAAALKENMLALVYVDNSIALKDLSKDQIIYKDYFEPALSNDTKIANPVFMSNIVLIPTLSGEVKVVEIATGRLVRNIVVDTKKEFSNITFLDIVEERLIAATKHKIISVGTENLGLQEYDMRDVIVANGNLVVTLIDGTIIKLNSKLDELAKRKYPFAKLYGMIYSDAFYVAESQGYLIRITEDFEYDSIYEFNLDKEDRVIALGNRIYFQDRYIEVE